MITKIEIRVPKNFENERKYIIKTIMNNFLGLEYFVSFGNSNDLRILLGSYGQVRMPDIFFGSIKNNWLQGSSMPKMPLEKWTSPDLKNITNKHIPIIYGSRTDAPFIEKKNFVQLPIDIFGSAFFMLTRYEESVVKEVDHYNRFIAKNSVGFKENFLLRPDKYMVCLLPLVAHL